jgi:hypothetical protein
MIDPFEYIPPEPHLVPEFKAIAEVMAKAYQEILNHCPQSRERSLAVTKLQESRMWANAAISFQGRKVEQ